MPPPFLKPWFNVVTIHMINDSQALSFRSPPGSIITEDLVKLLLSPQRSSPTDDAEQVCWLSSLLFSKIKTHCYKSNSVMYTIIYIMAYLSNFTALNFLENFFSNNMYILDDKWLNLMSI